MVRNRNGRKFNIKAFAEHPVVSGAIVAGLSGIFTLVWILSSMSTNIDNLRDVIGEQSDQLDAVRIQISEISKLESESRGRLDGIDRQFGLLGDLLRLYPTSDARYAITNTYDSIDAPFNNTVTRLTAKSQVAYSKKIPEMKYTAEQLAGQTVLLPYTKNGEEVYFYGQIDGFGRWDGHCIVNIYEDDELTLITDAQYDSGKLLSCRQAFPDSLPNGDDIWSISDRTMKDGFSEGETWRYFRDGDYKKDFTIDSVMVSDILDVDTFKLENVGSKEGYYHGNVSGGSYNDDTGNAYYVQYLRDGTIKTLYVGRFEKGNFHDMTGVAWMIGNNGDGTPYCYYKGPFNQGNPINDPKYWEEPLSVERVKEIVDASALKFNCELKWEKDKI